MLLLLLISVTFKGKIKKVNKLHTALFDHMAFFLSSMFCMKIYEAAFSLISHGSVNPVATPSPQSNGFSITAR